MATNKTMDGHGPEATITSPTEFHSLGEPMLNLLVLLLHVETLDGSPLPEKFLMGGGSVAYLGYVEAKLKIPGIDKMNKDSLFIVINDSPYTKRVPITIGTLHIREALRLATPTEIENLPEAWKEGNFPPISKQAVLGESILDLEQAQGKVKLTKDISIGPFDTVCFWEYLLLETFKKIKYYG